MLFAVEVLLHEVSARTLVPVALATTTATYVGRFCSATRRHFRSRCFRCPSTSAPAGVHRLGSVTAVASVMFIRTLYGAEDFFDGVIPRHPYLRHVVGMLGVGLVFTTLFSLSGHYYVQGVGYATIIDVLVG